MADKARQKTKKLVITFETNSQAMAAEAVLSALKGDPGRLIPLPQQISSGCGLAWSAPPEREAEILEVMRKCKLKHGEAVILEMY